MTHMAFVRCIYNTALNFMVYSKTKDAFKWKKQNLPAYHGSLSQHVDLLQIMNGDINVKNICNHIYYQHLEVASQPRVDLLSPYSELTEELHACNLASSVAQPEQTEIKQIRIQWSHKEMKTNTSRI